MAVEDLVFKDKSNNILKVGDFIAYAARVGNSAALHFGKVLDIEVKTRHYKTRVSLKVRAVNQDYQGNWYLFKNPVYLADPRRIQRVFWEEIHAGAVDLLDPLPDEA